MAAVVNGTGNDVHISAEAVPAGPRVYFIREGDAIKIGFSENVKTRLAGLQSGHHGVLELLGTIAAPFDIERAILTKFEHLRIRGEWFRAEPELLEFIQSGGEDFIRSLPPPPPPIVIAQPAKPARDVVKVNLPKDPQKFKSWGDNACGAWPGELQVMGYRAWEELAAFKHARPGSYDAFEQAYASWLADQ